MSHLIAVCISHKTAPVEQREKVSLTDTAARTLARERFERGDKRTHSR